MVTERTVMRERNIKKWTAEDLNKELHVQTLGPVEHFLAKEGYSAEDLMRPIGDEQSNQVITESVKHAEIRMRHLIKRSVMEKKTPRRRSRSK